MEFSFPLIASSILIPAALSPLVYLAGRTLKEKTGWLAFLILLYPLFVASYILINGSSATEPLYFNTSITEPFRMNSDGLSTPFFFTIALLSAIIAIYSMPYMKHRIEESEEPLPSYGSYFALYILYAIGMMGTVLATNLLEFYIYFELMLIPSFIHIALWGYGNRGRIAIMYFLWTHVGAVLLLIGILTLKVYTLTFLISKLTNLGDTLKIAEWIMAAIILGLLVKMAVFGVHIWLPYAHAEAPTPISALLSPAMVGIGGYAIIRIVLQIFPATFTHYSVWFTILAIITMAYGGLMALTQDDFKRFLAYSSISQMGYILLGISTFQIFGLTGAIIQYVSHGLGKAVLFMTAGTIIMMVHGLRSISKMGGLAKKMPLTAIAAFMGFLTIGGVPPLLGFQAEWELFGGVFGKALVTNDVNYFLLGVAAALITTLTVAYAVWALKRIFFGNISAEVEHAKDPPFTAIGPLLILAIMSLIFGVYPEPLIKFAYGFAQSFVSHVVTLIGG
jgi:NADH-quinone oxidoreductase subunit M